MRLIGAAGRSLGRLAIDDNGYCNQVFADIGGRRGTPLWDDGLLDLLWREGGVRGCLASQFTPTVKPPSRARATVSVNIELKNTSRSECSVDGYPGLRLLTPSGQPLQVRVRRDKQSLPSLATADRGETLVITATWRRSRAPCSTRAIDSIGIGIPGMSGRIDGSVPASLSICRGPLTISSVFNPGAFGAGY